MALQDYYNTNDDNVLNFGRTIKWLAQTFTAGSSYNVASVKLKLFDNGAGSEDDVTVAIRATSGGLPTGADLTSGTIASGAIPSGSPGSFIECIFSSPYSLSSGTTYAIVVRCDSGTGASDRFSWRCDATSPSYGGGQACQSTDTGSSWSGLSTIDMMFEAYDDPPIAYAEGTSTITIAATVTGTSEVYTIGSGFATARPSNYDSDKWWDEDTGTWVSTYAAIPGAWAQYLVVISEEGDIYFRTV